MTKHTPDRPDVERQSVFDAIASALQSLTKARGLLVEAQRPEQLHDVALELERAKVLAGNGYDAACRLYRRASDSSRRGL